jgi:outer membrane protein assembly factor BamB
VNLGDRMNQLADDLDTSLMPDAGEIRRLGDGFRQRSRQRRRRLGLATVAAGIAVVATVTAVVRAGERPSIQPARTVDGLQVARTIPIPHAGSILYAEGSVWVVDENHRELNVDQAPAGELYQIDPETGDVLDRIPEGVGGWPSAGGGAIWLCTAAGDLNVLTRVDLATHEVTRHATDNPPSLPHGSTLAAGVQWVADRDHGDLLRVDPATGRVLSRLHIGSDKNDGSPNVPVYDRHTVWVSTAAGQVVGVDPATSGIASRLQLPVHDAFVMAKRGHVLYAVVGVDLYEINVGAHHHATVGRELVLDNVTSQSAVAAMTSGLGYLWAIQLNPDRLLRIDPVTFKVTGSRPVTGINHQSYTAAGIVAGSGALWIRTHDRLLELAPPSPTS